MSKKLGFRKALEAKLKSLRAAAKRKAIRIFAAMSVSHFDDDYEECASVEMSLPNGDFYTGEWCNFSPHGDGEYRWIDGCVYQGEWFKGKLMGIGKFCWPSGATYDGEFKHGFLDGKGTFTGSSGDGYNGYWVMNLKHGQGTHSYANGDHYEGEWCEGLQEGHGRYKWKNGTHYIGQWKKGLMNGLGTMIWSNGNRYDGFWEDGFPNGNGTYGWPDYSFYVGVWSFDGRESEETSGTYFPTDSETDTLDWDPQRVFLEDLKDCKICQGETVPILPSEMMPDWPGTGEEYEGSLSSHSSDSDTDGVSSSSEANSRNGDEKLATRSIRNRDEKFATRSISILNRDEKLATRSISIRNRDEKLATRSISILDTDEKLVTRSIRNRDEKLATRSISILDRDENLATCSIRNRDEKLATRSISIRDRDEKLATRSIRNRDEKLATLSSLKMPMTKQGKKISKGHKNYELMLNLQIGIRHSVGRPGPTISLDLKSAEFDPKEKLWTRFPPEGSKYTPPHQSNEFRWKDYCPLVFRTLRKLFDVDVADYMISICGTGNDALREFSSPGKSGSLFYLTNDDKYMIKTMKKSEVKVLIKMLPAYFNHVRSFKNTLVTKFFGLHCVKLSGVVRRKVRFVIMGNLFCTDYAIHRRFDLKGSFQGRTTGKPESEIDPTTTLKDLDLNYIFRLQKLWFQEFCRQVDRDCDFLKHERIIDYSLLIGLHFQEVPTPPILTRTGDSENGKNLGYPKLAQASSDRFVSDPSRWSSFRLGVNMSARAEKTVKKNNSEMVGEPSGVIYDVILFFGIIDILQNYDISKKLEHKYKSIQFDPTSISAVNPKLYSKRFRDFILKVFVEDP